MPRVYYTSRLMTNGKITTRLDDGTERTDYLFRISIKAIIYNEQGQLLVVKEHGLNWGLPGGGLDFGETFETALARELEEEIGYTGAFTFDVIDTVDPMPMKSIDAWLVYVVFHVVPESYAFTRGVDSDDMTFIDPDDLVQYDDNQARLAKRFHDRLQDRLAR